MKKYQIVKAFLIIVGIILFLSVMNRIFYLNKHIRIHDAYIWAPQNIVRVDNKGFLVRIEVKAESRIKKGMKLGYMKLDLSKPVKSNRKKRKNQEISQLTDKFDSIMKENGSKIDYLSIQLKLISDYLSKSFNSTKREREKIIHDQNRFSLFFENLYKHDLLNTINKEKRLKMLYKDELVARSEITRQKAKINRLKLMIGRFRVRPNRQLDNIKLTIPDNSLHRLNLPVPMAVHKKVMSAAEIKRRQPEHYSYIISYIKGIVYKVILSAPTTIYPHESFFTYYKPKKMRIIAFYHITKDIKKGADVIIRLGANKIKGTVERIMYNDKSTNINDKIKLIIKAKSSIKKFPLYKLVTVDIKQSKWF